MLRMFTFFHALLLYFGLLFVPVGLHMERSVPLHQSFFEWPVWMSAVLLAGLFYWVYRSYKNHRAYVPILFFGLAWFFIALGPVSGITPINAQMYEHWLYVPIIGVATLAGYGAARLRERFGPWLLIGLTAYGAFFAVQTIRRNILWGNPIEFYQDILRYEPDSVRINNNLANHYFDRGEKEKARTYYEHAIAEEDIFPQPHYNIAQIYREEGNLEPAKAHYLRALELNPDFYFALQGLAAVYAQQGDVNQARAILDQLLRLRDNDPRVLYNVAVVYRFMGDTKLARHQLEKAAGYLEQNPDPELAELIQTFHTLLP